MGRDVASNEETANKAGTSTVQPDKKTTRLNKLAQKLRKLRSLSRYISSWKLTRRLERTNTRLNKLEQKLRKLRSLSRYISSWPALHDLGFSIDDKGRDPTPLITELPEIARDADSVLQSLQKAEETNQNLKEPNPIIKQKIEKNRSRAEEIRRAAESIRSRAERYFAEYIADREKRAVMERARAKNESGPVIVFLFFTILSVALLVLGWMDLIPFIKSNIAWVITIVAALGSAWLAYGLYALCSALISHFARKAIRRRAMIARQFMMPLRRSAAAEEQGED
jgi:hypothetical protein